MACRLPKSLNMRTKLRIRTQTSRREGKTAPKKGKQNVSLNSFFLLYLRNQGTWKKRSVKTLSSEKNI